ncbi:MAG: GGDEF domain-containing protein, partial [Vicinamibacterales bacterium]
RRRAYVLAWATSWIAVGGQLLLSMRAVDLLRSVGPGPPGAGPDAGRLVMAAALACGLAASAAVLAGARWVHRPARVDRAALAAGGAAVAAIGLASLAPGLGWLLAPGYAGIACLAVAASATFMADARRTPTIGGSLAAAATAGIALANLVAAVLVVRGAADAVMPNALIFLSAACHLGLSAGMGFLTFEDMADDLSRAIADLARAEAALQELAVTDALTGCHNRRFFGEVAARELARHRELGLPLSVLVLDCDRFKLVNDTLGHEAGDRVLQSVARILTARTRAADYVFRWGGDEFLVLMSCDESSAARKGEELSEAFRTEVAAWGLPPGVGLSVGCAGVPPGADDLGPAIERADRRMYERKRLA